MPNQVAYDDSIFPVTVTATYTYGRFVQGVAVVTFSKQSFVWWGGPVFIDNAALADQAQVADAAPVADEAQVANVAPMALRRPIFPGPQNTVLYTRTVDINSTSQSFNVDIKKDLGLTSRIYENIIAKVDFTEEITKKTVSTSDNIQIVPYAYSFNFDDDGTYGAYAPNTIVNVKLSLAKSDGTPVRLLFLFC